MAIAKNTTYIKELVALLNSIDREITPFRREWDNDSIRFKQRGKNIEIREVGGEQKKRRQIICNQIGNI